LVNPAWWLIENVLRAWLFVGGLLFYDKNELNSYRPNRKPQTQWTTGERGFPPLR
jgi:hypothetical protein